MRAVLLVTQPMVRWQSPRHLVTEPTHGKPRPGTGQLPSVQPDFIESYLMTTIEMSRPAAGPTQHVGIVIEEKTLRKNLRYAFANHFTVVQELVQNARRAGATLIDVTYDLPTQKLIVSDNGSGLKSFDILLRYAASGWNEDIASTERPFGMGFLSAVFSAREVIVVSGERQLRFDSAALLEGATFPVEPALCPVAGTRVELAGVVLEDPSAVMKRLARGYNTPLTFNGCVLPRIHAVDEPKREFVATPVGLISIPDTNPDRELYVYLQGMLVHHESSHFTRETRATVVHLNSSKWIGKFPDRDRCIDEQLMLQATRQAIQTLLQERLDAMKRTMEPAEFCEKAYDLALRLDRLEVFSDVDVMPSDWFGQIDSLPHSMCSGESSVEPAQPGDSVFSRAQFESGEVFAVELEGDIFPDWYSSYNQADTMPQLAWMVAYKSGAKVLTRQLHESHWIFDLLKFRSSEEPVVTLEIIGAGKVAEMPSDRTHRIGGLRIQLCTETVLTLGSLKVTVNEPWIGWADGETTLFAAEGDDVGEDVLRQCDDYYSDEELQDDELSEDANELNQFLRELATDDPKKRLELALLAALREYRNSLRPFSGFSVKVDDAGYITVLDAVERSSASGQVQTSA
jgi:hypothetical protein